MKKVLLFLCAAGLIFSFAGSAGAAPMEVELTNTGLMADAAGTLYWNSIDTSFTGSVAVSGLDVSGEAYQLKVEQSWASEGGSYLSQIGRTWDNYIWNNGDADGSLAGTAYEGVSAGNVHAANVGDYLSYSQLETLGHDMVGYFMYAYFMVNGDDTVTLIEDNSGASTVITPGGDGSFALPFYADFGWHTAGTPEQGFVTMPDGNYDATFLITQEWGSWGNPLLANNIEFTVSQNVPEPATLLLLGFGLLGLVGLRHKE